MTETCQDQFLPVDVEKRKFTGIWIPAEIWEDNNLPGLAKMLYAEIASFGNSGCWKKSEDLAEPLGIKRDLFQKLCQQLKDGGYITERRAFGRVVRTTTLGFNTSTGLAHQRVKPADEQPVSPADEQPVKPAVHIEYSKNIVNIKRDESVADDDKTKNEYGREDINELADLWLSEVKVDVKKDKNQRNQLTNLLRKYGCEATKALVRRVGAMRRENDRFAPYITKPSDLVGKYSKLDKLEAWEFRKNPQKPKPALMPAHYKVKPTYNGAWDDVGDEERAKVSEMMRKTREKLFK